MHLSGNELRTIAKSISNCDPNNIQLSSIDVTLDDVFWVEKPNGTVISTDQLIREDKIFDLITRKYGYALEPNEFVKARITETFTMPENVSGMFTLRSCVAQVGLEQATSIWLKPNWKGQLILELKNFSRHNMLKLIPGTKIGQIHLFVLA